MRQSRSSTLIKILPLVVFVACKTADNATAQEAESGTQRAFDAGALREQRDASALQEQRPGNAIQEQLEANKAPVEGAVFILDAETNCYDGGAPYLMSVGSRRVTIDPSACRACLGQGTPAEYCRPIRPFRPSILKPNH